VRYTANLAALLSVTTDRVELQVEAASVRVRARVLMPTASDAQAAAVLVRGMSSSELSAALGETVEAVETPAVNQLVYSAPPSPPPPTILPQPTPPSPTLSPSPPTLLPGAAEAQEGQTTSADGAVGMTTLIIGGGALAVVVVSVLLICFMRMRSRRAAGAKGRAPSTTTGLSEKAPTVGRGGFGKLLSKSTHSTVEINLDFVSTSTAELNCPAAPPDEPPAFLASESTVESFAEPEDSLASLPKASNVGAQQGVHSQKAYCKGTTFC